MDGIENVIGSLDGDTITGSNEANRLTGTDLLVGDQGTDMAVFEGPRDDYRITLIDAENVKVEGPTGEVDTLETVELLKFDDVTLDVATLWNSRSLNWFDGTAEADAIDGRYGDDVINGAGGTDIVDGGAGDNMLYGSHDADVFVFDSGDGTGNTIGDFQLRLDVIDLSGMDLEWSDVTIAGDTVSFGVPAVLLRATAHSAQAGGRDLGIADNTNGRSKTGFDDPPPRVRVCPPPPNITANGDVIFTECDVFLIDPGVYIRAASARGIGTSLSWVGLRPKSCPTCPLIRLSWKPLERPSSHQTAVPVSPPGLGPAAGVYRSASRPDDRDPLGHRHADVLYDARRSGRAFRLRTDVGP